jgi:hypothetical protein
VQLRGSPRSLWAILAVQRRSGRLVLGSNITLTNSLTLAYVLGPEKRALDIFCPGGLPVLDVLRRSGLGAIYYFAFGNLLYCPTRNTGLCIRHQGLDMFAYACSRHRVTHLRPLHRVSISPCNKHGHSLCDVQGTHMVSWYRVDSLHGWCSKLRDCFWT